MSCTLPDYRDSRGASAGHQAENMSVKNGEMIEFRYYQNGSDDEGYWGEGENLPGVFSEGDTAEELESNMLEAFHLAIETYLANGERVPWSHVTSSVPGSVRKRLLVEGNVETVRD